MWHKDGGADQPAVVLCWEMVGSVGVPFVLAVFSDFLLFYWLSSFVLSVFSDSPLQVVFFYTLFTDSLLLDVRYSFVLAVIVKKIS